MSELVELQRRLARLLRDPRPSGALAGLDGADPLAAADEDGLGIARLLVARLRFARLLQGSARAGAAFDADPAAFTETFRAYHASAAPRAVFPAQEAADFEAWLAKRGGCGAGG